MAIINDLKETSEQVERISGFFKVMEFAKTLITAFGIGYISYRIDAVESEVSHVGTTLSFLNVLLMEHKFSVDDIKSNVSILEKRSRPRSHSYKNDDEDEEIVERPMM